MRLPATAKARLSIVVLAGLTGAATSYVPWEELAQSDSIFRTATRFADVEGHAVHYETPTEELARELESRTEPLALRHLAEARMRLGDRAAALAALEKWSAGEGAAAWAESARWAHEHGDDAFAFRAAATALPGLTLGDSRQLAEERIRWAEEKPGSVDVVTFQRELFKLSPDDPEAAEGFLTALVRDHKADEALAAIETMSEALLPLERRALLRSKAFGDKGDAAQALESLDSQIASLSSADARKAFVDAVDKAAPKKPGRWRDLLEERFDADALVRLATYFAGQGRGDAALSLLRQMDRRHAENLDRAGWLLLSLLYDRIDAGAEAFRARLAAASGASAGEAADDRAGLADIALRAGGRPLAWANYNDESYAWIARLDETPGFWTGGLSLLLTGTDWKDSLERLEAESVRGRTFATARLLVAELEKHLPNHASLPKLRLAVMERFVEQGDGASALALLPSLERAEPRIADRARRTALLALRLTKASLTEELRLYKARLTALEPDGTVPLWDGPGATDSYKNVLDDAIARVEYRDPSHQSAIGLMLGEMDRLPDAEALWLDLASRLEAWNLDDELAPRYEKATAKFGDASWWSKLARFYARRKRQAELEALAQRLVERFRGTDIFARAEGDDSLKLQLPGATAAPRSRVRLVRFADFVRLRALERFPHSPTVVREAMSRLVRQNGFDAYETLVDERRFAVLFVDETERERWFAAAMKAGNLEERLQALEASTDRTPVHDLLLFEGWSRLSRFEKAHAAADRLTASYPGDEGFAKRGLSLHRSLASLDPSHTAPAQALVERAATALAAPSELWTDLGELYEDTGRPDVALATWSHLLEGPGPLGPKADRLSALLWDYGHMKEALATIEDARKKLGEPRLLAFEAGVLREEIRDPDGAVLEYLDSSLPDGDECFCSSFDEDQRALRRLVQLMGRAATQARIVARIDKLSPGSEADERLLAALFPLGTIVNTTPGLEWDVDDWIDRSDMPHDRVGREARQAAMEAARGKHEAGILLVRKKLVERTLAFVPRATTPAFLDRAQTLMGSVADKTLSKEQDVTFRSTVLARRAELAATEYERVGFALARVRLVADAGREAEADELWKAIGRRLDGLSETPLRLRAEAARAAHIERSKGVAAAAEEWTRLGERYSWSLGLLEDRLSFLNRVGRGVEARTVLEAVANRAAAGHRQDLLARLTRDSLSAGDLARAENAVRTLLDLASKDAAEPGARLGALRLLARLKVRQDPAFDLLALARSEEERFVLEQRPYLYAELARSAFDAKAYGSATTVWIEALNRRVERGWLTEAARAAHRGSKMPDLMKHFEAQQARSPRDVRWAIAVRELRLSNNDLEGAIAMSEVATSVRPERESLWRDTADLLSRAGRHAEAARFLEGWSRRRPADEDVAGWRASLFARAGDRASALAVERAALDAFKRSHSPNGDGDDARSRAARAARRLIEAGLPHEGWRLLSPDGQVGGVAASSLGAEEQARLALANDAFLRLLRFRAGDEEYRLAAGRTLGEYARPEQLQEFEGWVLRQIYPTTTGDVAALRRWWPAVEETGVSASVRVAMARRFVAATDGPWREGAGEAFVEGVSHSVIDRDGDGIVFGHPDLDGLWVRDLARRDRPDELARFVRGRFAALAAGTATALEPAKPRRPWTVWLDDASVMDVFTRGTAGDASFGREIAPAFADPKRFERLLALGARSWNLASLVAQLPQSDRDVFLRATTSGRALARLVTNDNASGGRADDDPEIRSLRGPLTVGTIVDSDSKPLLEAWGGWPGPSWFALETLVRYRNGDPGAALAVLETPGRGSETSRLVLASNLAARLGDPKLSRDLLDNPGLSTKDTAILRLRLQTLLGASESDKAGARWREGVRADQKTLTEARLRELTAVGEDLGLEAPLGLLDPAEPVGGALLAYVRDVAGRSAAARFKTSDPVGYRSALAARFARRESTLTPDDVATWLDELWASGALPLPSAGLAKLPGIWPAAAAWLSTFPVADRGSALAALRALPDSSAVDALNLKLQEGGEAETARLLSARMALLRGDDNAALALLDQTLEELRVGPPLTYEPVTLPTAAALGDESWLAIPEDTSSESFDPSISRLRTWYDVFRATGRGNAVRDRFRAALTGIREGGLRSPEVWRLALVVEAADARASLVAELGRAWVRGDVTGDGVSGIAQAIARTSPADLGHWMARWSDGFTFDAVARRARTWRDGGDERAASSILLAGRSRGIWTRTDEIRGFDLWRRLGVAPDAQTPPTWANAVKFWRQPAAEAANTLAVHLAAHHYDVLAARAALRSLTPAPEEAMERAQRVLDDPAMSSLRGESADVQVLRLRAARSVLVQSPVAARTTLGGLSPPNLALDVTRRGFRAAEIDTALADVARIGGRGGDRGLRDGALATLADRNFAEVRPLRSELAAGRAAAIQPFVVGRTGPRAYQPGDLDLDLVSRILAAQAPATPEKRP